MKEHILDNRPTADVWIPIRADFAEAVVYSFSGGVNELDIGACCTSRDAAARLKAKIDAALQCINPWTRDISLWLEEDEALCFAVASQNCESAGLPEGQRQRLDQLFEAWLALNPPIEEFAGGGP